MTRYAQNLIGDWETEQFEPLRQVAQNRYQTDWNKLSADFANLNEQLAQNFQRARVEHNSAVVDNARNAYNRMYSAEQDLASRGLTGSGLMNVYDAMNTQQQGQENNAALQTLMDANKANMEGRLSGLDSLAKGMGDLSTRLGDELAGITDAEGDNLRGYRDLISSISESAASRNAQYGGSDKEEELDRIYQLISIKDILASDDTDDATKYYELTTDAGVTPEQAQKILSSHNYNKVSDKVSTQEALLQKSRDNLNEYKNAKVANSLAATNPILGILRGTGYGITKLNEYNRNKKLEELNKELSNYTYEDLKNIMGYKGF